MKRIKIYLIGIAVLLATQTLPAQETGWGFTVGGGICGENVYVGSDDYYVMPVPNVKASYSKGRVAYSLSVLEGLGVTYMNPNLGLLAGVNINAGETRNSEEYSVLGIPVKHSTKTRKLLEGTPNTETPFAFNLMLAYSSPVGIFGVSLAYHPISVEYNQTDDLKDETRHGYMYSALYTIGGQATDRLSISGLLSVDFMDRNYADTWYTVERATKSLNAFQASAGLRSSLVAVEINYQISKRVNLLLVGATTILLGDARNSPFTVETVQRTMSIQTLYHF